MAPIDTAHPPQPRQHEAVAFTTAMDDPPKFYGACGAGDFTATARHDTQDAAKADVKDHVDSMQ